MGSLAQTFTFVPSGKEKAFALSSALGGSASVVDSVLGSLRKSSAHIQPTINRYKERANFIFFHTIKLKNSVKRTIEIKLNQLGHFEFANHSPTRF
jgi:hypothetical protein